jgi:hypothetical protein
MLLALVAPQMTEGFAQPTTSLALQSLTASFVYLLHTLTLDGAGDESKAQAHRNIVHSLMKRVAMGQIIPVAQVGKDNIGKDANGCRAAFLEGVLKVALNGTRPVKEFVLTQLLDVSDSRLGYRSRAYRILTRLFDSNTGSRHTMSPRPLIHV